MSTTKRFDYDKIIELVKNEVKPALGCTEPVAVALAVAHAKAIMEQNNCLVQSVEVSVSANILKNGMGVGIPGTGMVGLHIAAALGISCGCARYGLEVLKDIDEDSLKDARQMLTDGKITISLADCDIMLYISATCKGKSMADGQEHIASAIIQDAHDNLIFRSFDDIELVDQPVSDKSCNFDNDDASGQNEKNEQINKETTENNNIRASKSVSARDLELTVRSILDFACEVDLKDIEFILEAESMNRALANEGLRGDYGLMVGKKLMESKHRTYFGEGYMTYAMAFTAAASDARMAGCPLPAMSNSGSGNQGLTVTLPVVAVADKLSSSREELARALILSHLVAIHIKSYLGRLSALCGCIVASAGSSCGIIYLHKGTYSQMCAALKNMIGNITGMVCDGAKVGCALKVASGVSSAIQSAVLAMDDICISPNDGIIEEDIEQTIRNLASIGSEGMKYTDKMILRIMSQKK